MSSATTREPITIHLAPEQRAELEAIAHATSRKLPDLVGEAVEAYIEQQHRDIAAIKEGLRQADAGEFATDEQVAAVYARRR